MLQRVALVRSDISEERSCGRLLLITANVIPSSPILVILMMEALRSSEMSLLTRATRCNITEEGIFQLHMWFHLVTGCGKMLHLVTTGNYNALPNSRKHCSHLSLRHACNLSLLQGNVKFQLWQDKWAGLRDAERPTSDLTLLCGRRTETKDWAGTDTKGWPCPCNGEKPSQRTKTASGAETCHQRLHSTDSATMRPSTSHIQKMRFILDSKSPLG
jgi:hypothetical protein